MDKKIFSLGLILLIASGIVFASICEDAEWMNQQLESAEAQEKAAYSRENLSSYYFEEAASSYNRLADCSESNKNYDDAIKYRTKSVEMSKNAGMPYARGHVIIARYYSKNNSGFNGEIREHCEIAEKLLLEEIEEQLARDKPSYSSIYLDYGSIADCYKLINDTEKACMYCFNENEYEVKAGRGDKLTPCDIFYGCEKASPVASQVADSGGGLSFVLLVMAFLSVVIFGAVFLLVRRKK